MAVAKCNDGQITSPQRRPPKAGAHHAKTELIHADAKSHRQAVVVPTARSTAQVDATAVGDEAGFGFRPRGAEDDGVEMEIGIDVTRRRDDRREEFVARAIWLAHGGFAVKIDARSKSVWQRG